MHMIASLVTEDAYWALREHREHDPAAYARRLSDLPGDWPPPEPAPRAVFLKEAGEYRCTRTSPSSSAILSAGRACRLRRCSRVVSIWLRKLLAGVPVCDVNVHTDGFPLDRRIEPCLTGLRLSASAALAGSWTKCVRRTVI